jgi:hypothetical protein
MKSTTDACSAKGDKRVINAKVHSHLLDADKPPRFGGACRRAMEIAQVG